MTTPYEPVPFSGNPTTTQLNAEFERIRDALNLCLQRIDATQNGVVQVNQMELPLDMNDNEILNVADASTANGLVSLSQVQGLLNNLQLTGGVNLTEVQEFVSLANSVGNLSQLCLLYTSDAADE